MAKSELVYEFLGSRNLFTTPIDITGLQGDKYDYELVTFFEDEGGNSELQGTFNNDTATNYRKYNLQGDGSSPSASTAETRTAVEWGMNCYSFPTLGIFNITGDSSGERVINGLSSQSSSSGDTRVSQKSMYWKDTLNEITSIQLKKNVSITSNCHIMLYRVPKAASQGNWEKVDELTWAAESAEKSFTGLDGNRDKKYKVVWSGDDEPRISINADQSVNYTVQELRNENGTIKSAPRSQSWLALDGIDASIIINAVSGQKRLCIGSASKGSGGAVDQGERATWWGNTLNTLNTIELNIDNRTLVGTATLYRMKGNGETDGSLPWELIEEVDVSGDFSSGHVFSNLTGNSEKLFRVEFVGEPITASLLCRFNSDSGSNYPLQWLAASTSTPSAGSSTETYIPLTQANVANVPVHGNLIIYPKSGQQRPALIETVSRENLMYKFAGWWTNTIDEINSILIYSSNTDVVTGKLKLWRLNK